MEPNPHPSHSSNQIDLLLSVGRVEANLENVLNIVSEQAINMSRMRDQINELPSLAQLQLRHDRDIEKLKDDIGNIRLQQAWFTGAAAVIGAIASLVINWLTGHFK